MVEIFKDYIPSILHTKQDHMVDEDAGGGIRVPQEVVGAGGVSMEILHGDCVSQMSQMSPDSVDSIVTDPPYELGFMGQSWDSSGVAFRPETWAAALRVLKPGGHMFAFGGTRTYHRMVCAIEDAGFEIRDQFAWVYGTGFPKSHDVAKAVHAHQTVGGSSPRKRRQAEMGQDYTPGESFGRGFDLERIYGKARAGHRPMHPDDLCAEARKWQGWGTAAKPAWEPICLARKPLAKGMTVAAGVLAHGTGALNINGCRVATTENLNDGGYSGGAKRAEDATSYATGVTAGAFVQPTGRWPANLVHDGSDEVLAGFPGADSGSAARFFYCAKAGKGDRAGSKHPTVKPVSLMRWLVRMITPPGGVVLDPFAGSGTTGQAAMEEGFRAVLIEREAEYVADIRRRFEVMPSNLKSFWREYPHDPVW